VFSVKEQVHLARLKVCSVTYIFY